MINRLGSLGLIVVAALSIGCGDSGTVPSTVERLDGTWSLLAFENTDGTVASIENPSRYTATFSNEGRVNLLADCNRCFGPFSTSGLELGVGNMGCTRAACPAGSKSEDYIQAIAQASSYLRHDRQLFIYHPGGRLRLEQN